jgi:threonine synthase
MQVVCPICQRSGELSPENWKCTCEEAWEPLPSRVFDTGLIDASQYGLWRYGKIFGLDHDTPQVSLGAGWTPLLPVPYQSREILIKVEYLAPSGSFKDRGTEVEINTLMWQPVETVIDDSSGNAGSSLAAYAARAGLKAEIYVPHYASENKKKQIAIYGADVHSIPGVRNDAKLAAMAAVGPGKVYASHAFHPCFLLGQESVAWEVWEQMGGTAPDWYVVPVGQGVHLLGAWLGFSRLKSAGLIAKVPRMVAVQPTLLNPIASAMDRASNELPELHPEKPSLAEGLAITKPVRWKRILQAIRESQGMAVSVSEEEIISGQNDLAHLGFYAEPTSATVMAAVRRVMQSASPTDKIVVPLTGSGLKGAPKID